MDVEDASIVYAYGTSGNKGHASVAAVDPSKSFTYPSAGDATSKGGTGTITIRT